MPSTIWKKYKFIKEIESKSNIKTYLSRLDPIIKEIIPKDKNNYYLYSKKLEKLKCELDIYEILEENNKFYIVANNNEEILSKIDKLILSDELYTKKEGIIQGQGYPITKEEIDELFKKDKSMCKISYETIDNKKGKGSGFFCKLDKFPIKYALFTNNHILNEFNIEIGKKIYFEYLQRSSSFFGSSYNIDKKQIEITEKRRIFTNKELDYTCIELYESDGIYDYFQIEPNLFKYGNQYLIDNDIFILQYPSGNDLSFSCGKILSLEDNEIVHNASTEGGSSGSPIIRRSEDNYVVGLHSCGIKNIKDEYEYNLATSFISILDNIKEQINEIICTYKPNENDKEINLLHDYNSESKFSDDIKNSYLKAKNLNKNLFENNIDIFIDKKKIKFDYKYKIKESQEIKVKFKFKTILTNISFMFYECSSLESIDLSSFNTNNVNNMEYMFWGCSSLKSIDLSSFNTNNVNNMSWMFYECSSLKSIDLSSFNTNNVNDMHSMFSRCSSLKTIDLSSFNTTSVKDMSGMFSRCSTLNTIDLSLFNTINVKDMSGMFSRCSNLRSINLSSFKTFNVNDMSGMFCGCSSLESIDLSSFNTINVNDMSCMFCGCSSLESLDLSSFNTINVSNMECMFDECSSLQSIDLSSFKTTNVNNMNCLFYRCSALKKENIKIDNKENKLLSEIK